MRNLPTDWTWDELGELCSFQSGSTPSRANDAFWGGPTPWITAKDMKTLRLFSSLETLTEAGRQAASLAPAGTVLVLTRGMGLFKDVRIALLGREAAFNQDIKALRPNEAVLPEYLAAALQASKPRLMNLVDAAGHGTGRLSTDQLKALPVPIPPRAEQARIVELLCEWDRAIAAAEALALPKRQFLFQLRRRLLEGAQECSATWRYLHECVAPVTRRNDGRDHPIMTISSTAGFILQSERYDRHMAGESLATYTLLHEGEFSYNRGNSGTYPWGCVFRLDRPSAVVPSIYFSFSAKDGFDVTYLDHVFRAGLLNRQLRSIVSSSARLNGLLNISRSDFFRCRILVPEPNYQRRAGAALSAAERDLQATVEEAVALRRQKQGMMQKLFLGEWRVSRAKVEEWAS